MMFNLSYFPTVPYNVRIIRMVDLSFKHQLSSDLLLVHLYFHNGRLYYLFLFLNANRKDNLLVNVYSHVPNKIYIK